MHKDHQSCLQLFDPDHLDVEDANLAGFLDVRDGLARRPVHVAGKFRRLDELVVLFGCDELLFGNVVIADSLQ